MRIRHTSLSLIAVACALLAAGCARTYNIGFAMGADNEAAIEVRGWRPYVSVKNSGPGIIEVDFESARFGEKVRRIGAGVTSSTVRGPGRITIKSPKDSGAELEISARRARGLSIEMSPRPRDHSDSSQD
jgi:hypothetical protein